MLWATIWGEIEKLESFDAAVRLGVEQNPSDRIPGSKIRSGDLDKSRSPDEQLAAIRGTKVVKGRSQKMKSTKMPPPPPAKAARGVAREEMREGMSKKPAMASAKKQIVGGKVTPKGKRY